MRIAINTLSENPDVPSGAFGYYQNLIGELDGLIGDNILYILVSQKSKDFFGPYTNPNIRKIIFKYSNERKWFRILTEHFVFPFVILKNRIQVLNTGTAILWSPCKLVATLKTMHVYTNPESISLPTRIYRKLVYKLTKWNANAIISNSDSQTQDIIKYVGIKREKIKNVYEALDHNVFVPTKQRNQNKDFLENFGVNKPYILFVSSLYRYKNAETLIRSYKMLKDWEKLQLVFVGFPREMDYYDEITQLIVSEGIKEQVIFTGGVPLKDTARFYQSALMFVYPSLYETFGLTILESMACGCPVITSNISAMPEIGADGAIYFNPQDKAELTDRMEFLLKNQAEKSELITLGLKRSSEFTWKNTAKNTLEVYKNLMNQ
jgi:glycosyltransferase involved in cell wall biosynthesis